MMLVGFTIFVHIIILIIMFYCFSLKDYRKGKECTDITPLEEEMLNVISLINDRLYYFINIE